MLSERLVNLLNRVIGNNGIKLQKQGEYSWFCPFHPHHKPKFQINVDPSLKVFQKWHCWVCNRKGRSLYSLLKQLNASPQQFSELSNITGVYRPQKFDKKSDSDILKLPSEFIPMWIKSNSMIYKHAMAYLKRRNLSMMDIIKYGIGYCESGIYKNRIIIPSYDSEGQLNFFIGRDFYTSKMKYRNCNYTKDIIGFDFFINWDEDIILTEGAFDAFAIKRNVIPLFGKTIQPKLKKKILKKNVKRIYVSLDTDAIMDSLKIVEDFMNYGISVHFVDIPRDDPGKIGFHKMIEIIKNTPETKFSDLMRLRLSGKSTKRHMEIF